MITTRQQRPRSFLPFSSFLYDTIDPLDFTTSIRREASGRRHTVVLQSVVTLALHLVLEVEVSLVEVVDTYVAVLSAARVALAGGVRRYRVLRYLLV